MGSLHCRECSQLQTPARAAQVVTAATEAATANRAAAEAWDALATQAAAHADQYRRGAELADRTRHRWAR